LNRPQNKILVIRGGAIGDFILTLPVLSALRRQFPQSRLEVLGYPHIAQLALAGGLVDAVRSIEARALAGFFAAGNTLTADLADYFAGFALILSYLYDPDGVFQTNVARCSKAQFIAGPHRPDEHGARHATEVLLQPIERLAIFDPDPAPKLPLAPRPSPLAPLLALHPGSGSECKNWPEPHWAELLRHGVAATAMNLLLVGGEAEGGRLDRLARCLPPSRVCLARSLPLADLAAALNASTAFVGHDSGITHLAVALGVPALVLWGETNETVWSPRGDRVTLLRHPEGLANLPVNVVARHLSDLIAGPSASLPG
jgi:heptosyltransferase-2